MALLWQTHFTQNTLMMKKEKIIVSTNSSFAIETGKNDYIEKLNFNANKSNAEPSGCIIL